MRLFTKTEAQKQVSLQNSQTSSRKKEVEDALVERRVEMAKTESDFASLLASFRIRWANEEEEHKKRVDVMTTDVTNLEHRRKQALVPIDALTKEAENKMQEALNKEKDNETRAAELQQMGTVLANRLDAVFEREQALPDKEQELSRREQGIRAQEENTSMNAVRLGDAVEKFSQESKKFYEFKQQKELEFAGKETYFLNRYEKSDQRERELNARETKLADRIQMFERRIKRK